MNSGFLKLGLLLGLGYGVWKLFSKEEKTRETPHNHWGIEAIEPAEEPLALSFQVLKYQSELISFGKDIVSIRAGVFTNNREETCHALLNLNERINTLFAKYREILFKSNDFLEEHGMEPEHFYWEISPNDKSPDIDPSHENDNFVTEVGEVCDFLVEYIEKVTRATQKICSDLQIIAEKMTTSDSQMAPTEAAK